MPPPLAPSLVVLEVAAVVAVAVGVAGVRPPSPPLPAFLASSASLLEFCLRALRLLPGCGGSATVGDGLDEVSTAPLARPPPLLLVLLLSPPPELLCEAVLLRGAPGGTNVARLGRVPGAEGDAAATRAAAAAASAYARGSGELTPPER